eukprot:137384-Prorocentrum_minimum.AAC.1
MEEKLRIRGRSPDESVHQRGHRGQIALCCRPRILHHGQKVLPAGGTSRMREERIYLRGGPVT